MKFLWNEILSATTRMARSVRFTVRDRQTRANMSDWQLPCVPFPEGDGERLPHEWRFQSSRGHSLAMATEGAVQRGADGNTVDRCLLRNTTQCAIQWYAQLRNTCATQHSLRCTLYSSTYYTLKKTCIKERQVWVNVDYTHNYIPIVVFSKD